MLRKSPDELSLIGAFQLVLPHVQDTPAAGVERARYGPAAGSVKGVGREGGNGNST